MKLRLSEYTQAMPDYEIIDELSHDALQSYDLIIDVRSPSEYAGDHLPGAINLPVLDDAERAETGTLYKQVSSFVAKRRGAALTTANISRHLDTTLKDLPEDSRLLIYCWRGGMRSRSMALVLSSIGWDISLVKGGYQTWRRQIVAGLDKSTDPINIILLDGQTGTAKTAILKEMAALGAQTLDLEGMANHRGSAFGAHANTPQPGQKRFEALIWQSLRRFDLTQPIYVEAESSLVGKRRLPSRLWAEMKKAPRIIIEAPTGARADYLVNAYPDLATDLNQLTASIERLAARHSTAQLSQWHAMARKCEFRNLAESLMVIHYDAAYNRARMRRNTVKSQTFTVSDLEQKTLSDLAQTLLEFRFASDMAGAVTTRTCTG
ncbi:MAG: tRNA 2-selenouridine(34) synthase MnmH [Maricaulis sp.]|nr:tRNA 2-selenouridine(34) synthase MnmH [Maricaulis sp.]MDG2043407.1 tRNA 2-selenouridine(34) synthase MnmH [Maricaulis sp.]